MSHTVPKTSHEAYEAKKPTIFPDHQKIISALQTLGKANYEKIADACKMDRHAVGRRMKELEGLEIVCKPGSVSLTKRNRKAFDYVLTEEGKGTEVSKEYVYKKGQKTAAEYASDLIKSTSKKNIIIQQDSMF